jgi:hypothetical protein
LTAIHMRSRRRGMRVEGASIALVRTSDAILS